MVRIIESEQVARLARNPRVAICFSIVRQESNCWVSLKGILSKSGRGAREKGKREIATRRDQGGLLSVTVSIVSGTKGANAMNGSSVRDARRESRSPLFHLGAAKRRGLSKISPLSATSGVTKAHEIFPRLEFFMLLQCREDVSLKDLFFFPFFFFFPLNHAVKRLFFTHLRHLYFIGLFQIQIRCLCDESQVDERVRTYNE